jgi:hypothetical protein
MPEIVRRRVSLNYFTAYIRKRLVVKYIEKGDRDHAIFYKASLGLAVTDQRIRCDT